MTPRRYLIFDFETYSELDVKKVGAWEYSKHVSTEYLCVAWKLGTRDELKAGVPTRAFAPRFSSTFGGDQLEFLDALADPGVVLVAHNAAFERFITENVLAPRHPLHKLKGLPVPRWLCTASLAAARSLPRSLEGAGRVLGLAHQKDMAGHRLMLKLCKPRKPTKYNPETRHLDPKDVEALVDYCVKDIEAETGLFLRLPPLAPTERKVWCLDQAINTRGFYVDRKAVKMALRLIDEETNRLTALAQKITGGAVKSTNQRAATLAWVKDNGVALPDLKASTVDDAIKSGLADGAALKLLKIRRALSKTSTAKYLAFDQRSRSDSRLRDILMYHAAGTARWGGMGVQPQNFPRGTIKETETAIELIKAGDLEMLRLCLGDPMTVFSSCLRGMIIAPPGRVLDVADYASIEVRVLFWLAGHDAGVEAFLAGKDMYKELAASIFGVKVTDVTPEQRFLGKTATLGCGYSIGAKKFQASCAAYGLDVSEELAKRAVNTYRERHAPVVRLWGNYQRAAFAAVADPTKRYTINRVTWFTERGYLVALLPSGRKMCYYRPSVRMEPSPWDKTQPIPVLKYWATDGKTRQWAEEKTYGGKLVENVTQAVARDLMAEAMLRIEDAGWQIVLTVHDELIGEIDKAAPQTNADFCRLMAELPAWADGCPVAAEGFRTRRYRKG